MKKTTNKTIVLLLLALGLGGFSACEDFFETVVEVEVDELDNVMVVNYIYHQAYDTNPGNALSITKSKGPFEDDVYTYDEINNATALLFEGDTQIAELQPGGGGYYFLPQGLANFPKWDTPYTLKVSAPGLEATTATNQTPPPPTVSNFYVSDYNHFSTYDKTEQLELVLELEDEPDVENYYYLRLYVDSNSTTEPLSFTTFDVILDDDFSNEFDELDPEYSPPQFYDDFNSFADFTFDGERKQLIFYVNKGALSSSNNIPDLEGIKLKAEIGSMSKELYRYKRSLRLQQYNDGNPFAEPVPVFNNIEGGLGIFAGFSHQWVELELDID